MTGYRTWIWPKKITSLGLDLNPEFSDSEKIQSRPFFASARPKLGPKNEPKYLTSAFDQEKSKFDDVKN